jgi:tRNA dimethylallyltransferase
MLKEGLIEEVQDLRRRFSLSPSLPSMRCVGYRQVWQYLDGGMDVATLRDRGIAATRQLAKRQLTWLRALHEITRFDCLAENLSARVNGHLAAALRM